MSYAAASVTLITRETQWPKNVLRKHGYGYRVPGMVPGTREDLGSRNGSQARAPYNHRYYTCIHCVVYSIYGIMLACMHCRHAMIILAQAPLELYI